MLYQETSKERRYAGGDILAAPSSELHAALREVLHIESPIHVTELVSRVAGMWGNRAGSKIRERIIEVARASERSGFARQRGDFYWSPVDKAPVRSRTAMFMPADRIAPEEYGEAIRAVLANGHAFDRAQLITEVRSVLGFARTGVLLEEAINAAIHTFLQSGVIGEAGEGLQLKQ